MKKEKKKKHKNCKYGACPNWLPSLECGYRSKANLEKDLKKLHKKAWDLKSQYIRRVEKGICYSCGESHDWKECNAGHFIHGKEFDFVDHAIHCQCIRCNNYLSGNLGEYAVHMMKDFGVEEVDRIRSLKGKDPGLTESDYLALIENFKGLLKLLDEEGYR